MKFFKKLFKVERPNEDQQKALDLLLSTRASVFLTGPGGVGKSFVIRRYIKSKTKKPPILASTGAAAVQIGGRTFHSFFGLGIMEGGFSRTVEKASSSPRITKRLLHANEVIIDEVSMIHPQAFAAADAIAKNIRGNSFPFGGLRLILLGDFLQLPPVDRFEKKIPWLFSHPLWQQLNPQIIELRKSMRTESQAFVDILNKIRMGAMDVEVESFLNSRVARLQDDFQGTVLFGRRADAESFNQSKLDLIQKPLTEFKTHVSTLSGITTPEETLINYSPISERLYLKEDALVMIRKNDPDEEYVNGSLGHVKRTSDKFVSVQLLSGKTVDIPVEDFHILDGDGKTIATVRNFPLSLGWASTIHKSQGASIDRLHVNLKNLWECGQAYVALSRAKDPNNLFIEGWTPGSIKADPEVVEFYRGR